MIKSYLTTLTGYNIWASQKITERLNQLPEDMLDTELKSSYPSLRKTIYHIWDGQIVWLKRLQGQSLRVWPSSEYPVLFPGFDQYFIHQCEEFDAYIKVKSEDQLNTIVRYETMNGKSFQNTISEITMHCMNHGTYHRGQLITMMRNLNVIDLPQTDLIVYLRQ